MTDITNSGFIPKKRTVCALGLFDGVHRGHQLIITTAVKKAQSLDGHSAVFCFKTDTVTSKGHDGRIEMLMSDEEKHKKMAELGVEVLFSPDFAEFKFCEKGAERKAQLQRCSVRKRFYIRQRRTGQGC